MSDTSGNNKMVEDAWMPHPFEQQDPATNFAFHKSAATPQHGQKPEKVKLKLKEPRSFEPRPGH